ncbi:MAG: hypothetical protein K0R44_1460, partial [Thermomicrobiales bacterium]|nr:hypothetical protein [Thermomicrobiales bacterium]
VAHCRRAHQLPRLILDATCRAALVTRFGWLEGWKLQGMLLATVLTSQVISTAEALCSFKPFFVPYMGE